MATRGTVHTSVRNPAAGAPWRSAVSMRANCGRASRGLRPNRPAALSPWRPSACQARYHRDALIGVTPRARATAPWLSPRANSRAAASRRVSSFATSSRLGMLQLAIVAHADHNFI